MGNEQVHELDINKVVVSPLNPRLDLGDITELAESMKRKGIQDPLKVRKTGEKWEVAEGGRRLKAAKKNGLKTVPCIVRKYTDNEVVECSIIENVMRKDLTPLEKATALKFLLIKFKEKYKNQETLAYALGVSPATISVWLSVLEFGVDIQKMIGTEKEVKGGEKIPMSMAQEIRSRVQDPAIQKQWIKRALENKWGTPELVRELERTGSERRGTTRPIFISLKTSAFAEVLLKKQIVWASNERLPQVGEVINITTPRVRRKVLKTSKNDAGKTIVEFGEVE